MAELSEKAVYLCGCRGKVSQALPMDAVCRFLEARQPGLRVIVGDNFCEPRTLSALVAQHGLEPLVVGACSQLKTKLHFWEEPDRADIDPYSIGTVDVLREACLDCSAADRMNRVVLLLLAQVARQQMFSGVPQEALKVQFARPQGKMSRRDLFEILLPQYRVMPYVQAGKCNNAERCRLCQENCASDAIVIKKGRVSIDKGKCQGCGTCTTVCPYQAVTYPTFSVPQLEGEMEGLLLADGDILQPRIVVLSCQTSWPSFDETESSPFSHAPSALSLEIPCLNMVSCWLLLRAFELGAQGVALVSNREKCPLSLKSDRWRGEMQFAQTLLERWGIEPERVRALGDANLERDLMQFAGEIGALAPTTLGMSESVTAPTEGLALPALIANMTRKLAPSCDRAVSADAMPFGKVELDASKCTGCGICALDCPTGALRFASDAGWCRLLFDHRSCVGCGRCQGICPEKCLELKRVLELDRLDSPPELVFEGEMAMCRECGAAIAPKAMIEKLRARIGGAERATFHLNICPACRAKGLSGMTASVRGV